MSNPNGTDDPIKVGGGVKTLAIRLEPDIHAQLTLIAGLRSTTITDEIRSALSTHVAAAKDAADLANRADEAMAEIERDAAARRDAIAALFGTSDTAATSTKAAVNTTPTPNTGRSSRSRKASDGEEVNPPS